MRVLLDILDPAQVHFFRFLYEKLRANGHEVLIAARDKGILLELLDRFGMEHLCLSTMRPGLPLMALELLQRYAGVAREIRRFRPDVLLGITGISIGLPGALAGVPRVAVDLDDWAHLQRTVSLPFASRIVTGSGYERHLGARGRRFNGVWVQAYVGNRYYTPDPEPLRRAGVTVDRPYIVARKLGWHAVHDARLHGAPFETWRMALRRLERFGPVYFSTEDEPPDDLKRFHPPIAVEHMHDLLAFATLYIGEGATMAAEAGVLGAPAVATGPYRWGYMRQLEDKHQLIINSDGLADAVQSAEALLRDPQSKARWNRRARRYREITDDVVDFLYQQLLEVASSA